MRPATAQTLGDHHHGQPRAGRGLYTPSERARRDATVWTLVQGILAPVQFLVFLVSLFLVLRYLTTGSGYGAATASIVVKTLVLYTIMVTGSIWEKVVFGKWLFAPAFFWEDVVSMGVIALHTLYLGAVVFGWFSPTGQMTIALAAYAIYVVNAAQFLWKLRMARLESEAAERAAEPMRMAEYAQ
jgi:3-vinyl bacteriochlorophyllide hydratase